MAPQAFVWTMLDSRTPLGFLDHEGREWEPRHQAHGVTQWVPLYDAPGWELYLCRKNGHRFNRHGECQACFCRVGHRVPLSGRCEECDKGMRGSKQPTHDATIRPEWDPWP